ncbi:hypothetical protein LJB95_01035 [Paludibacteraceae bacterium OttesenSCG-928-F17]|nr:hypothetical protein [Paludibacteraceae bacterium OttesenSCG-928-F17]
MENEIITAYAQHSGIPIEDILGPSRKQNLMIIRECIWYTMRYQKYQLKEIARIFNRKHSSIHSGINTLKNLLDTNHFMLDPYQHLLNMFTKELEEKL